MVMKGSSMKVLMIVGIVMMCYMVVGEAAIPCGTVTSLVSPCISYLRGSPTISSSCCSGIRSLVSEASTTADRRSVCYCLKAATSAISGIDYGLAAGLPGKCGVSVPYKISPNTDCSKVN